VTRGLGASGFAGANVTIPHKLRALEIADSATATARAVGAANTLVFGEGGIHAHNTDPGGFLAALAERSPGAPAGMRALVLGAGGAARAVVFALIESGAAHVQVWNRGPARAQALVQELGARRRSSPLEWVAEPDATGADLLVNATAVGMKPPHAAPGGRLPHERDSRLDDFKELRLSADDLGDRLVIVDLTYRDGGSSLVREARARGLACADGLDVLVHQGADSFRLWTGREAPIEAMRHGAGHREDGSQ
jgi:shikimate dehydrogenase